MRSEDVLDGKSPERRAMREHRATDVAVREHAHEPAPVVHDEERTAVVLEHRTDHGVHAR
jgi:hypothetical protein